MRNSTDAVREREHFLLFTHKRNGCSGSGKTNIRSRHYTNETNKTTDSLPSTDISNNKVGRPSFSIWEFINYFTTSPQ